MPWSGWEEDILEAVRLSKKRDAAADAVTLGVSADTQPRSVPSDARVRSLCDRQGGIQEHCIHAQRDLAAMQAGR